MKNLYPSHGGSCDSQGMVIEAPPRLDAVRDAARMLRSFLAANAVDEAEINDWELVTVEAGVNAVEHASSAEDPNRPVKFLMNAWPDCIELCVSDSSMDFQMPSEVTLPPDDSERGRGLYLMSMLTDSMRYLRGRKENFLILRRARASARHLSDVQRGADLEDTIKKMTEELGASFESLSAIFRFSSDLGKAEDAQDCAKNWLDEVLRVTGMDFYILRQYDKERHGLHLVCSSLPEDQRSYLDEVVPTRGSKCTSVEARAVLDRKEIWFDSHNNQELIEPLYDAFGEPLAGFTYPIYVGQQIFGVLTIGSKEGRQDFNMAQVNVVHTFADFLAIQLSNDQVKREAIQARLVNREIKLASDIQKALLPRIVPAIPGCTLAVHTQTAHTMGGDFYDVIEIPGKGALLAIADVMGKGMPAAIFATMLRSHIRARSEMADRPAEFLTWLNSSLFADLDNADVFVTAQLVFVDYASRQITVASAGHIPALVCEGVEGRIREIYSEGPALGFKSDAVYEQEQYSPSAPYRLLLFTDGLTEARSAAGRMLGQVSITNLLSQGTRMSLSADQCRDLLLRAIGEHQNGAPLSDDLTFILLAEDPASNKAKATPLTPAPHA